MSFTDRALAVWRALLGESSGTTGAEPDGCAAGGLTAGTVTAKNVVVGEQHHHQHTHVAAPETPTPPDLLPAYLRKLRRMCELLPLGAVGGDEGTDEDVTLDRVYTELDTTVTVPVPKKERKAKGLEEWQERRTVTALEVATEHSRLVLLGGPGSGKSTFVKQLCARLATTLLGEGDPLPGFSGELLPVFVQLRDFAARIDDAATYSDLPEDRRDEGLSAAFREQIAHGAGRLGVADFGEALCETVEGGRCLLVLDGLDEIPESKRQTVRDAVSAVCGRWQPARLIVTCRVRSYVGHAVLPIKQNYELAPFDSTKVASFCSAWYRAQRDLGRFGVDEWEPRARDLTEAANGDDLRELSSNPMLLTTMALVHQREVGLPRERVKLYKLAVEVMLRRWQERKVGKEVAASPELNRFLGDERRLREAMELLAYEAHSGGGDQADRADLGRGRALELLERQAMLGDPGVAGEFLDYVDQRSGLLLGQGGEGRDGLAYTFPHRTFQEYLAGCWMVAGRSPGRLYWQHVKEGDTWALAGQLGAEELLLNRLQTPGFLDLAYDLCPECHPADEHQWRACVWSGRMAALLDPNEIRSDTDTPSGGNAYLERLASRLQGILADGRLTPIERVDAANARERLGYPCIATSNVDAMPFCWVPGGSFWMGGDRYDDEKPQHLNEHLDHDYWLAQYPVTVAQFREYVEASGNAPDDEDALKGTPTHPVGCVSWQEATGFCEWLTGEWLDSGRLPAGWRICLPSEAEWEKAARGGVRISREACVRVCRTAQDWERIAADLIDNPDLKREYPWLGGADPNLANYGDTHLGTTSPVGCFASGASPVGCEELAGNVWEWTRSVWGKDWEKPGYRYPYDPREKGREILWANKDESLVVLRGGAFHNTVDLARCAYRHWRNPVNRDTGIGFRVVASPFDLTR